MDGLVALTPLLPVHPSHLLTATLTAARTNELRYCHRFILLLRVVFL